jgi:pyruvate formate lyase activating enzyme
MKNKIYLLLIIIGVVFGFIANNNLVADNPDKITKKEAMFYAKLDNKSVACELCPRNCVIETGKRGFCRNRENQNGTLYSIIYNQPCSIGIEPIEKAPFYHFLPGQMRLTLATAGCNQRCKYCQNWEISQKSVEELNNYYKTPQDIIKEAQDQNLKIICFTYSEPTVFYEYMYDIAVLARQAGIKTAVVSGGYINPEPLKELCKIVDAIKIDLKGFNEDFYQDVCGTHLQPVLDACKIVKNSGVHFEIVNLVVPTLNDDTSMVKAMCEWIKDSLGTNIPLHFTRFYPQYKLPNLPPTPISTLENAVQIACQIGLKYVYIGNVAGHEYDNTYCPNCSKLLIKRQGYTVSENNIVNEKCKFCGAKIYGIFSL